jgi:hypothetical protein
VGIRIAARLLVRTIASAGMTRLLGRVRAKTGRPAPGPDESPSAALWIECERHCRQVAAHVAWRLGGRSGAGPRVGSTDWAEALVLAVALESPGAIAEAAGALWRQTELLGKRFVRDEADPWTPDPADWDAMLAEWQSRDLAYREVARLEDHDAAGGHAEGDPHRHRWSRTYTIRPRRTGGWLLEYGGNPSQIVVLPDGAYSALGTQFRECEECGSWESRKGSSGPWGPDAYDGSAPSPRVQILTEPPP